jgi:hypothetical protein
MLVPQKEAYDHAGEAVLHPHALPLQLGNATPRRAPVSLSAAVSQSGVTSSAPAGIGSRANVGTLH